MLFATMRQGQLFLWMMAAGVIIGLWLGAVSILRRIIRAGFWLTLACDLLFGLGAAVILCGALIWGNWGQMRPFALLGTCIGVLAAVYGVTHPLEQLLIRAGTGIKGMLRRLAEKPLVKFLLK